MVLGFIVFNISYTSYRLDKMYIMMCCVSEPSQTDYIRRRPGFLALFTTHPGIPKSAGVIYDGIAFDL